MKITMDDEARRWLEESLAEWEVIADDYYKNMDEFKNWKQSPTRREDRRESITYGNLSQTLRLIMRMADYPESFSEEAMDADGG